MTQIFFKKGERKPSIFSTLGILTTGLTIVAFLIAGPAYRIDFLTPDILDPADSALRIKLLHVGARLAVVAALFTLVGFIHGATSPRVRISWRALVALVLLVPTGYAALTFEGWIAHAPAGYDISTNPKDPPSFAALQAELPDTNPSLPEENYRDLLPITLSSDRATAIRHAAEVVQGLGWQLVKSDATGGNIEARGQSPWFGFESLIVIRVREKAAASILDIRAVSRLGTPDIGNNVRLIRNFRDALAAKAD